MTAEELSKWLGETPLDPEKKDILLYLCECLARRPEAQAPRVINFQVKIPGSRKQYRVQSVDYLKMEITAVAGKKVMPQIRRESLRFKREII